MLIIQILIIGFALFAIYRALRQFRMGSLPIGWLVFWMAFWSVVVVAVSVPQATDVAAGFFGVGRGVDLVMYLSVIALFYFVFRMFVKIEEIEREITHIVRAQALEEMERDDTKTDA